MFAPVRRFPLMGLALIGLGFLLATTLAGAGASAIGSAIGFALFLPLLILKVMFMFFLFGLFLRFVGGRGRRGGWGPGPSWGPGGGRHHQRHGSGPTGSGQDDTIWRYRGRPMRPTGPATTPEQAEWEEHLRQARREVDDLDTPYDDVDLGNVDDDPDIDRQDR